jgi:hypothetical protein
MYPDYPNGQPASIWTATSASSRGREALAGDSVEADILCIASTLSILSTMDMWPRNWSRNAANVSTRSKRLEVYSVIHDSDSQR